MKQFVVNKLCLPQLHSGVKMGCILSAILAVFVLLLALLPMNNAVQIGADEGYELAKATLSMKGYKMYTEVWNDQPPLHTFLISQILRHVTPSIAGPRLLTSFSAMILLSAFFFVGLRLAGLLVATISTVLLLASPIFLELGASCMVEIPAMAPAVVVIALLLPSPAGKCHKISGNNHLARVIDTVFAQLELSRAIHWGRMMLAGILLAVSLQIKFINVILLPLIALIIWLRVRTDSETSTTIKRCAAECFWLGLTCLLTFFVINQLVDGQGFMVQFRQSWSAHFASTQSFEYGSPSDHPFDWRILVRNWDTAVPAAFGLALAICSFGRRPFALLAGAWLVVNLAVFIFHKPWWSCYYLHIAVPLSLCAGIGVGAMWRWTVSVRAQWRKVLLGILSCSIAIWAIARVSLEVRNIRNCPRVYTCLFLEDMARYKPFVQWLYTDEPVYSFHAGIPMPPEFAVVALKRMWSGDMSNAKITARLSEIKPGMMLLPNDGRVLPFRELLAQEYQVVYQDQTHRLFVHRSVVKKSREAN